MSAERESFTFLELFPREAEHQIVLQIVTDVLGLKEAVDWIQVEELLWERESRTKEKPPEIYLQGRACWN